VDQWEGAAQVVKHPGATRRRPGSLKKGKLAGLTTDSAPAFPQAHRPMPAAVKGWPG